ncbi:MAG: thermonuclease family protein [Hyphomicrobiales bacterium]
MNVHLIAGLLGLGAVTALLVPQHAGSRELVGRATVIDGDTLDIRGERLRLHGIDAPEAGQWCLDGAAERYRCGQRAALALADRIGAANIRCDLLDRDRYDRHVARCFHADTDLNEWMVRHGQAVAYRQYSMDYAAAEAGARDSRSGLWQGAFDLPWEWRRGARFAAPGPGAQGPPSAECNIKGNISRNGKIYHVPGQTHYERTRISPDKGERWFCSEAEAEAAGWRRAKV